MDFLRAVLKLRKRIKGRDSPRWVKIERELAKRSGLLGSTPNMMGSFGSVVFEVSTLKVETLRNMKRVAKARYASHEIVGQKTMLEFTGLSPDEISFDMQLNADLGVDVETEMWTLLDMLRNGEANYLILGDHVYGQNKFVIDDLTFNHQYADRDGNPYIVEANVSMKEMME